jgi:hypothetical protein
MAVEHAISQMEYPESASIGLRADASDHLKLAIPQEASRE